MATLAPVQLAPRRKWNTLEILTRSRTALLVLTVAMLATFLWAASIHHGALKLVGEDTVPSILQAQKIKTALAEMDADAADELLYPLGTRTAGLYDRHRIDASNSLVEAAKNVTYGEAETRPIDTIETVMGTYERLVQEARDLQAEGLELGGQPGDDLKKMSLRYYRAAAIVMDGTLLPAADALDKANNDVLVVEFESRSKWSLAARVLTLLAGIAMLLALIAAQLYLSRRTQRTLNPALAAATALTLGLALYAFTAMASEQSDLNVARQDAFTSIHALLQARALAYAASADESRFLLDPDHAAEYQRAFDQNADALAHTSIPINPAQLQAELRAGEHPSGFSGYLADELNNITFKGELEAATETVAAFEQYLMLDHQIRSEVAAGQTDHPLLLAIGNQEGQSHYLFTEFDQALGQTLAINQSQYDASVQAGVSVLAHLDWIAGITSLLIAVLIFLGFAPRIREYV